MLKNIYWHYIYRIVKLGLAFFITAWIARYLGPNRYGELAYAIAFAELVMLFWTQGLKEVVIQQIKETGLISSEVSIGSFQIMLIGNTILYGLLFVSVYILNVSEIVKILILICGGGIWFRCFEAFELWFHSSLNVRVTVRVQFFSLIIYMISNSIFILNEVDIIWFGISYTLQLIVTGIGFIVLFSLQNNFRISNFLISKTQKKVLKMGVFMILAKLTLISSLLIDRLVIEQILGLELVGVYSASMKMITTWVFISSAISLSMIPVLNECKEKSDFKRVSSNMFGSIATISLILAFIFYSFSTELVLLVFGVQYSASVDIFSSLLYCLPFLFLHEAVKSWMIVKELSKYYLLSMLSVFSLNIGLNFYLIPKYALQGAAVSFVLSWILGGFIFFFLFNKTQPLAFSLLRSFIFPITLFSKFFSSKD